MTDQVKIFDTTLRDGEQSPGISLDVGEKLEIAEQLARLGVDVIEAGFPIASQGDFEAVEAIAKARAGPDHRRAVAHRRSRTSTGRGRRCATPSKPRIHVFIATSPIHMKKKLRMTEDQVKAEAAAGVARAKGYSDDVEFSPEDGSRSDVDFIVEVCQLAVDNGATTLNIPDTVGYGVPEEFAELIALRASSSVRGRLRRVDALPQRPRPGGRQLAGRRRGRRAAGGVRDQRPRRARRQRRARGGRDGDRARAATTSAPSTTTVQHRGAGAHVAAWSSRLTGYPVQYNKAVVGRNAFAHEAGIHQHGVLEDRETYEIIDASTVGQEAAQIVLGKHSGPPRVRRLAGEDGPARAGRRAEPGVHPVQGAGRPQGARSPRPTSRRSSPRSSASASVHRFAIVSLEFRGGTPATPSATRRAQPTATARSRPTARATA